MKSVSSLKLLACALFVAVEGFGITLPSARAEVLTDGTLTFASPLNPAFARPGRSYEVHSVSLVRGATYTIDLRSTQFDTYLILTDEFDNIMEEDDDSGGNLNAQIVFRAPRTGTYRIYATSFSAGALGNYRLHVRP